MDLTYLLNILLRRKWLILSVSLLSAIATWFIVGNLRPAYKAKAVIATGIIDYKGVSLQRDNPFIQQFQIESSFNSLIEKMKSRIVVKLLTEKLLKHDLNVDGSVEKPFREPKPDKDGLTKADIDNYALKLKTNNVDTLVNAKPQSQQFNNRIAEAFGYDYETLLKKLDVKRIGATDYLSVEFESETPELSFFVVNTFIDEFLKIHENDLKHEKNIALNFHTNQVKTRKQELDAKIQEINDYKKINNLVDLSTQRESVVGHLKDLELKREEQYQKTIALEKQIPILNAKILQYNEFNTEDYASKIYFNDDFIRLDKEIKKTGDQIIEQVAAGNNSTGALEAKLQGLKNERAKLIGKNIPVDAKTKDRLNEQVRDWITEVLEKQLELEFAKAAVKSYDAEIAKQTGRAGKLLTDDNHLATLQSEKDRLEKEYLRATEEYDKAKLYAEGTENPLTIIEPVELPHEPESTHKALLSAFAAVASGTLASIFLLFLAFVDSSFQSPVQFQRATRLPLLGYVNSVKLKNTNLQYLFANAQADNDLEVFKENIRKLRTGIENSGAKTFLYVSTKEQSGKSFLALIIAYALSLNNKKVLLIDTNFKNNTLSRLKPKNYFEISTGQPDGFIYSNGQQLVPDGSAGKSDPQLKNIDIIGNKGGNQSPSEILAGKDFGKVLHHYGQKYDYIFLEAAAANTYADARELIPFIEKVVAVFSTQSTIGITDKETIEMLRQLDSQLLGCILNKVDLKNV